MSEYQYYEFQAIDRPLTKDEMAELRRFSTRADITANRFVNEYHYGDFKGNEDLWMERYFDAHLYFANWGTKVFMIRLPKNIVEISTLQAYTGTNEEFFTNRSTDTHTIVTYAFSDEDGDNWDTPEAELVSLIGIRSELAQGDYRALYLGWLHQAEHDEADDSVLEPPVPPGLATLSAAQSELAQFFDISIDLIGAAARASSPLQPSKVTEAAAAVWVGDLPPDEKDSILIRLLTGNHTAIASELVSRFHRSINATTASNDQPRRALAELRAGAEVHRVERLRAEKKAAEEARARKAREEAKKREEYLNTLVGREAEIWGRIDALAEQGRGNTNDEAIALIEALRDLAGREGKRIRDQIAALRMRHPARKAFQRRLDALALD